ncbi:ankyrin repeat domain-containing protein [Streptomyces sp. NBC_00885]|uniref:ankyrin repeat domain-containing protein n=1 Tax=Streptomyces sp. NBC_00885 TaxID=2975857 RepID=UPI003863BE0C|nr:ankyrin repeat domain-containing protein [Streptomyces sp. NBC_00885]
MTVPDEPWSEARFAVEIEDLERLRELVDAGADVNETYMGMPLLHHAIDTEADGALQSGQPLHVDTTAYLLSSGADPRLKDGQGRDAHSFAEGCGHWLALKLIVAFTARH